MVEIEKEPCKNCGDMGIIQDFRTFPGRFAKSYRQQVIKYTWRCITCGGKPVWEKKSNT